MMIHFDWIEWFGYLASVVVLISLTMASIVKLRWINLIGALMFSIYGVLIHSIPVALLNLGIVLINIYYLFRHYSAKERFVPVEAHLNSELFDYFLNQNRADIERIVSITLLKQCRSAVWLMHGNTIAGLMVGDRVGDILEIKLDYAVAEYRDYRLGAYFFVDHPEFFKARGIKKIYAHAGDDRYRRYLQKMGFRPLNDDKTTWVKELD